MNECMDAWIHNSLTPFFLLLLNDLNLLQKYLLAADEDKKRYMEQLKSFQQSDAYQSVMKKKKGKGFSPGK